MTREEAEKWLISLKSVYGYKFWKKLMLEAFDMAIAALREKQQRQPDPDTGLVPCVCGGKAGFHYATMMRDDDCFVECGICGEHSKVEMSEGEARDAWNTAMGWKGGPEPGGEVE